MTILVLCKVVSRIRCLYTLFLKDLGVFIPAPMAQGMRSDFFLEGPFMPPRMKMDRDPLGGLADMFGQMPGDLTETVTNLKKIQHFNSSRVVKNSLFVCVF